MFRGRSVVAGTAVLALAFTATGCGSSALSAEEFRTQANKICTDGEKSADGMFDGINENSTEAELNEVFAKVADLLEEQADQIDDLAAPKDLEDDVESMLESLRDGADKVRDKGVELMQSEEDPLEDATKKADDLGLEACGS